MICPSCGKSLTETSAFCNGCGTRLMGSSPEAVSPTSLSGKLETFKPPLEENDVLMGRYQIVAPLKRGGMGAIYEVRDNRLKRNWALKEMIELFINEEEKKKASERFEREATMLASIMHPNLPRVIDYFEEKGRFYLVMDFIVGDDLQDIIKQHKDGKMPQDVVIGLAKDILNILDYLHSLKPPVVYRDIKPSNIMIRKEDRRTMLIDFGIARTLSSDSASKTEIGTVGYAPPEQYAGNPLPVSDIYALGAAMHELLTGVPPRIPFQFAPLRELVPEMAPALEEIVAVALRLEPERRWKSAREMLSALEALSSPGPSAAVMDIAFRNDNSTFAIEPPESGRKTRIDDLPGLDTKTIGVDPLCADRFGPGAVTGSSVHTIDRDTPALRAGLAPGEKSPRSQLSPEKEQAFQKLHKYKEKFRDRKTFEDHRSLINTVVFNPQSEILASASMDGTARLRDLLSGSEIQLFQEPMTNINALSFSSDGRHVAYTSANNHIKIYDLKRNIVMTEFDKASAPITALMHQPNELVINVGCSDGELIIYNYASQSFVRPKYNKAPITALKVSGDGAYIITGHRDGTISQWDVPNKRLLNSGVKHEGSIKCLAFSPNNKILASGSSDGSVVIWSMPKLSPVKTLKGNAGEIYALDFVPDNPYLITSSGDHTLRIWDLPDGELNVFLEEPLGLITSMAFKVYQATYFASSTYSGHIYLWKL